MANPYRLDKHFEPLFYTLLLSPDLTAFSFTGEASIQLKARRRFSSITLHALELKITRAVLYSGKKPLAEAKTIRTLDKYETATLAFGKTFRPGSRYVLKLCFAGTINDKLHGFYRTAYTVNGKKHWGGATQFEATDARRAFPCWDEPDAKARFQLTLRVPKHLTALSNMPPIKEKKVPGTALKEITYAPTVRMSTYLLAWVIAKLEYVQRRDKNGVPVRIWTTPGKKPQAQFALDVGCHVLAYFAEWFGIPYALPKMDMVALPDFASGAMENWGLVTYRETTLLVDPKESSAAAKQRVAEVIAHELAHQWFGNLVTMEWWTDLWLNEGFASYLGPKAVDDQFPEWKIWNQFVAGGYLAALHEDSLKTSHPIEIPVQNPHEIREIFDSITYSKGSSVNRMLELYLTEPVFRRGLSTYLKRYAYRNARTTDLWVALEEISGKPVTAIMASFTKQEGYPVLSAERTKTGIRLTQHRFLADGSRDRTNKRWSVPLVGLAEGREKLFYGLLQSKQTTLPLPKQEGWVKLNAAQGGFYRIAYSAELNALLVSAMNAQAISALDCLGLIDDAFALAKAGRIKTSQALNLLSGCQGFTDYNLWLTLAQSLGAVEHLLSDETDRLELYTFGRYLFGNILEELGWEARKNDSHLDALLRALVISRMGHFADEQTVAEANRRFAEQLKRGNLSPNLRGAVYAIVAEYGAAKEHAGLLAIYKASTLQEERVRVLRALIYFKQPALIQKTLAFALSEAVRKQDAYMILGGFGANRKARAQAWRFIKKNWKELTRRYASGGLNLMSRMVEGSAGGFITSEDFSDARRFFKFHPVAGCQRAMARCLETIATNLRWVERDRDDVSRWLQSHAS